MALVGDAVIAGRQTIPDMPQPMMPPSLVSLTPVGGGTLTAGTYFIVITAINQWGETSASNEMSVVVGGGNSAIQVAFFGPAGNINNYRLYYGFSAGGETGWIPFTTANSPFLFTTPVPVNGGAPPQVNRAWLPDTDGPLVSATAIYGWLNDGLTMISRETGGLLDYSGVPSVLGQPFYSIVGSWNEITSVWYDGYWMKGGDRGMFYRRNVVTSQILSSASMSVDTDKRILEVYPQPARTAASTTLANPMAASDTTALLTNAGGFVLPFGFMQVDLEVMAYAALAGNSATGLIRGLGGSPAVAHLAAAPVNELNIFWSGKRQSTPAFQPGQSQSNLPVPSGWEVLLAQYISGRAKMIEHDTASWDAFQKEMRTSIKGWAGSTKGVVRRRQVGGDYTPATIYDTPGGGLILP